MRKYVAGNGVEVPFFIYGTAWKKDDTARLVKLAAACGFTGIDTANQPVHYNEVQVGDALRALAEEGIEREGLFVQTKFTPVPGHGGGTPPYDPHAPLAAQVAQSFESSLEHLGTDYVDSYLLHGPYSRAGLTEADREVWAAIETVYRSKRARVIGVSNVTAQQLRKLCQESDIKPMVVQNRCFATLRWDREVRDVCREFNIVYQGFSLLTANRGVFSDPLIANMAQKHAAAPAPVVFRFAIQAGMVPLTGTTSEEHMRADLRIEKFTLSADEVHYIENIAV